MHQDIILLLREEEAALKLEIFHKTFELKTIQDKIKTIYYKEWEKRQAAAELDSMKKNMEVFRMRENGQTFASIAKQMGVTTSGVTRRFRIACRELNRQKEKQIK